MSIGFGAEEEGAGSAIGLVVEWVSVGWVSVGFDADEEGAGGASGGRVWTVGGV